MNRARIKQALGQGQFKEQFQEQQRISGAVPKNMQGNLPENEPVNAQGLELVSRRQPGNNSYNAADSHAARLLLQLEAEVRRAATGEELDFIIANETRKLTRSRQIFVFRASSKMRLTKISGLPNLQRAAPLVNDFEQLVTEIGHSRGFQDHHEFSLNNDIRTFNGKISKTLAAYPFPCLLWSPFKNRKGEVTGGMLLAREQAWNEADTAVTERLADTFQHAAASLDMELQKSSGKSRFSFPRRKIVIAAIVAAIGIMALPVSMSSLAPFEIVAAGPFVVSAPFEGVIEEVLVEPGETVAKDQPLVRFSDTLLRNRFEVAKREVFVAEARLKKASQLAFSNNEGRHGLRLGMAELALKNSEFNFASQMYQRATIKAQRAGIAVYSNKQALIGKPVIPGELILQIADPALIEINIDVALDDAILLETGGRVKIYLDSDPLHAREAKIAFSDYQARQVTGDNLAFRTIAQLSQSDTDIPRIGVRGTAQLFGEKVPLAFYLFRRPFSALRQWIGI